MLIGAYPGEKQTSPSFTTGGWDIPGGIVVKMLPSNPRGAGSIPGRGAQILYACWPKNNIYIYIVKNQQYCNKSNCCCLVSKSSLTLCDPMDCSLPGFSVHGIFRARILEWVAISCCKGSSQPRDRTQVFCISCIGRRVLYQCNSREAQHIQ